jgi:Spy/CpxP family protein refolding chaperone
MKRRLLNFIVCTLAGGLLFITAFPAHAEDRGGQMAPPAKDAQMEKDMAAGEKAAGISQEQREKMKALREEFQKKQKPLREQIKAKHEALRQELDSANPDRAKAETIAKEMNDLQGQAASNRIDEVFKLRTILTPEQFQKLREFHEKNKAKFQDQMKERKGGRTGGHGSWHEKGGIPGGGGDDIK